jgi:hypothetical protein
LTLEDIVAAAKAHYNAGRAQPGHRGYYLYRKEKPPLCCPIMAAYREKVDSTCEFASYAHQWACKECGKQAVDGLMEGWDEDASDVDAVCGEAFAKGFADGKELRQQFDSVDIDKLITFQDD